MDEDSLDSWFRREVLPHDQALTHYLQRSWPHPDDVPDLRQEAYVRIYESARTHIPTSAKPFIFVIARRLMADRIRKRRIVAIDSVGDFEALDVLIDDISPERDTAAHQELRQLAEALDALPPKCREVLWLRRIDDLSQKEVAARLGLSEKTVERHITKGMKRISSVILGAHDPREQRASTPEEGREHGEQQRD